MRNDVSGALVDGNYELRLNGSLVTQGGVPLSDNFVFGDNEADGFYSFYGDADGDRDVDNVDFSFFLLTYFRTAGLPNFSPVMDFEADGDVDNVDFSFFLGRYFQILPFSF